MKSNYGGYMGKVLKIDLSTREVSEYPWSDTDRERYLGGKIMAAKILYDNVAADAEAYGPENWLVVSTGPLTGTGAPSSSRFNVSGVSPLTGLLASSNCGGPFGTWLKKAGYDALIVTGKSPDRIWIEITEAEVLFHPADDLWGKTTTETQETLGGRRGKLVIGPAGENLVRYAGLFSADRTAGRAGLGAVLGSKNVKAITADGTLSTPVHNREKAKKLFGRWIKMVQSHPLTGEALTQHGTGFLVRGMQQHNLLATHNFKYGQFKDFEDISGHTLTEKFLIKNIGCPTCPIHCSRQVELNGKKIKGPELETMGLLGPNLDNNNLARIIEWNYQLDELGMDTISTGSVIGFAMELQEKGLWNSGLEFGKTDGLAQVFDDIAYRRGIGDLLAEGTRRLADKFGGREFAINAKGLELAAYEPRGAVGHGLGYATANRGGCHLNAGYLVLMEGLGLSMSPYGTWGKAALVILNQNLMESISAAGNCLFPLFTFVPGWFVRHPRNPITWIANKSMSLAGPPVGLMNRLPAAALPFHLPMLPQSKAVKYVTGMKVTLGVMKEIGERGYNLERMFNQRRGLTEKDDSLPQRLTDDPQIPGNPRSRVPLAKLKRTYYRIRGWDATGGPTAGKKRRLKLQ